MEDFVNFDGNLSNYYVVIEKEKDEWKASVTLVQGRKQKDGKWDNRKVEFFAIHSDRDIAAGDLWLTFASYLNSCDGDLFLVKEGEKNVEIDSDETPN